MIYRNLVIEDTGPHFIERVNVNNCLQMGDMQTGGWIKFHSDGTIETSGDIKVALKYLLDNCWSICLSKQYFNFKNITIYDYLIIDLENFTIKYTKPRSNFEFMEIKKIIELEIFRKMKLKAFW